MGTHSVFVYGTLMRGQPNHHLMIKCQFLGEACTVQPRAMVIASRFNIPFLLHHKGDEVDGEGESSNMDMKEWAKLSEDKVVYGELYLVDDQDLERLDKLENIPKLYWRRKIEVKRIDSNEGVKAFTYVLPHFKSELASMTRIERYDAKVLEKQGCVYVPPHKRGSNTGFIDEVRTSS